MDIRTDIIFLKEMKSRLIKYVNKKDVAELEMVFKMMDDWIDDLRDECNHPFEMVHQDDTECFCTICEKDL